MRLYLVRHAAVTIRPEVPGPLWHLSPEGRAGADALAGEPYWAEVEPLYTSPEPKAAGTAQRIAAAHGLPVRIDRDLREVEGRGWVAEGYEALARRYLAGEDTGWEARETVRRRVTGAVERAVAGASGDIGVVSHGLALTVFLAGRLGLDGAGAFDVWSGMSFPHMTVVDV